MRQTNPNYYYQDNPDASRMAAINVLARSGKLPQLIERAGEQLKKTPNAIGVHQALADYYKASGQRDKARDELGKIIALRPDDSNLRIQVAQQLVQEGQTAAAIEHYKAVLKKDPSALARNFWQVQNAFQQAGKSSELADLLNEMDLRQFGQPWMVFNMISNMFYDDSLRDRALPLFKKAWEAFPYDRTMMMQYVNNEQIWQLPEMYDYAREGLIPKPANFVPANQWNTMTQILSWSGDGRVNTIVSRLLDLATSQGKLDDLAAEIDRVRKTLPGWTAGGLLRTLIDCRLGRHDQAAAAVRKFLAESKDDTVPMNVYWVVAAELENQGPLRDLAVTAYETCLSREGDDPYSRMNYDNGPAKRLVALYERDKRMDDARRVLIQFSKIDESKYGNYVGGYVEQLKVAALGQAAVKLHELGFAADAVTLYNQAVIAASEIPPGSPNYIGNADGMVRQYRDGLTRALEDLRPEDLAKSLTQLVAPQAGAAAKPDAVKDAAASKPDEGGQGLDLMVMVHPRELDKASVRSLLADAIAAPAAPAATAPTADEKKGREQLEGAIQAAGRQRPDDLAVAIAGALFAISTADAGQIDPALKRLDELVDKTPLEALPPFTKANARQRAVALRQVPLWLVARACWKEKKPIGPPGFADKLAARPGGRGPADREPAPSGDAARAG